MVLFAITVPSLKDQYPIRATIWFWVQYPILKLFVYCCVILLWHWSDRHFLVLMRVLGCVNKFSVDRIKTGHMDLLAPQAWRSSWWGWWFIMHTILKSLIISDLKGGEGGENWSYQHSLILKLVLGCDYKFSVAVSKPDILIFLPNRFVEGCGNDYSELFVLYMGV